MKFPIAGRLFVAVLLSMIAVAAASIELVRWKLFDNFSQYATGNERDLLTELADALAAQYRQHHDWSFIPAGTEARAAWLRDAFLRSRPALATTSGGTSSSPSLGYRIGLLDQDERYLAGAIASPVMVAVASIDRRQRPIVVGGAAIGYLVVATPQNPDDDLAVAFLIAQQRKLFAAAAVGVLLSALAAAALAANFRRPIRQLVAGARRLESGQFGARLAIRRRDELGELAQSFNHLAARLEDTDRARRQWVADTSHELRTPLAVLRGQVESLQDGVRPASPDNIALLLRQILSLTKLVDDLYESARADIGALPYDWTECNVWQLVRDVFESFAERFRAAGLTATMSAVPVASVVRCDAARLRQVLTNLLENCVRYTAAGGRVEIACSTIGNESRIAIDDSAPGVPESAFAHLGERFFRIESSRSRQFGGAGLGLAIGQNILEAHGGRLEFAASHLGGLRVTMILRSRPTAG